MLTVLGVVLCVAILLVVYGDMTVPRPTFKQTLFDLMPSEADVAGWKREVSPLAGTPEMQRKVARILEYDDAVNVVYSSGTHQFSIYIAYWKPGTASPRAVAAHTPDTCWIGSGWKCSASRINRDLAVGGNELLPAQERCMVLNGRTEHVLFWHVDRRELFSDGRIRHRGLSMITDLMARGLHLREEQFFVRISSQLPVTLWEKQAIIGALFARLTFLHSSIETTAP